MTSTSQFLLLPLPGRHIHNHDDDADNVSQFVIMGRINRVDPLGTADTVGEFRFIIDYLTRQCLFKVWSNRRPDILSQDFPHSLADDFATAYAEPVRIRAVAAPVSQVTSHV